ncbi:Surfeit locus protein 1, partial [Grifola frondosa]
IKKEEKRKECEERVCKGLRDCVLEALRAPVSEHRTLMLSFLRSFSLRPRFLATKWPSKGQALSCRRSISSSSRPGSSTYKAKQEPFITPTLILVGAIPIVTFGLGTWQVQRLKWKVALIDDLEEKLQREPMLLPKQINLAALPEFAFRKVLLRGHWDHKHSLLLGPRVRDGTVGYHLVVPFIRSDGSVVLVNRGFVEKDLAHRARQIQEDGEVEILGMLRTAEVRNYFTPDNHPEKGEWYWVDVDAMAKYFGGERSGVQPVFVEEIFEGHAGEASSRMAHGIPVGRSPTVDIRNSHVSYIVTWYALSAFTSVMFVRLLLKRQQARARLPR